jgi:hypothetical protein
MRRNHFFSFIQSQGYGIGENEENDCFGLLMFFTDGNSQIPGS